MLLKPLPFSTPSIVKASGSCSAIGLVKLEFAPAFARLERVKLAICAFSIKKSTASISQE